MILSEIAGHLTRGDDPGLWHLASASRLAVAEAAAADTRQDVYALVGCCRHWISPPHPIRWVAGGRYFAWPFGYDKTTTSWSYSALPELSWSETLKWTGRGWVPGRTGGRCLVFRVAIPARTARYRRAAVHTVWAPRSPAGEEKVVQLFGFCKREGIWSQVATEVLTPRRSST
jgi:hypothetical protein